MVELVIKGSRAPSYTVFKLQDPPRLVVDLAGADVSRGLAGRGGEGRRPRRLHRPVQGRAERVGRVIVALEGARRYEVTPRGDAVVVKVLAEGTEAKSAPVVEVATAAPAPTVAPAAPVAATPAPAATAAPTASPAPAAPPAEKVVVAEEMHLDAAPAADDHVVSRRVDETRVSAPARVVTGVTASKGHIVLKADGDVGRIEVIELRDPPRLVLDLHGVSRAPTKAVKADRGFTQVRFGRSEGKVRVVLDTAGALPGYEVKRVKHGIVIGPAKAALVATTAAVVDTKALPTSVKAPAAPEARRVARADLAGEDRRRPLRPAGRLRPDRHLRQGTPRHLAPRRADHRAVALGRGAPEEARALARHDRVPGPGHDGLVVQPAVDG